MKREMFWRIMAGVVIGFFVAIVAVIVGCLVWGEDIQLGVYLAGFIQTMLFVALGIVIFVTHKTFDAVRDFFNYPVTVVTLFIAMSFLFPTMAEHIAYQNVEKIEKIFDKASAGEFGVINAPIKDLEEVGWTVKHLYCRKISTGEKLKVDSKLSKTEIVLGEKWEYTISIACGGRNDELHVFSYNKDKILK